MLIITRTVGESIVLPHLGVTITVLGVRENPHLDPVRLGIEAPKDIKILREELIERKDSNGGNKQQRSRVSG